MTDADKMKHCKGCKNDFYNGNNPLGVRCCWALKDAKLGTRYEIGTWTTPDSRGAFREVKRFQCYHAKGLHYYVNLPSFVKAEDVRKETAS